MPQITRVDTLDDREYRGGAEDGKEVEATETREFSIAGQHFRTYLSEDNARLFDDTMLEWTEFAEKISATGGAHRARRASSGGSAAAGGVAGSRKDRGETSKIREWAQGQNFDPPVSDKGRIPDKITQAYYAAHPEEQPAA